MHMNGTVSLISCLEIICMSKNLARQSTRNNVFSWHFTLTSVTLSFHHVEKGVTLVGLCRITSMRGRNLVCILLKDETLSMSYIVSFVLILLMLNAYNTIKIIHLLYSVNRYELLGGCHRCPYRKLLTRSGRLLHNSA